MFPSVTQEVQDLADKALELGLIKTFRWTAQGGWHIEIETHEEHVVFYSNEQAAAGLRSMIDNRVQEAQQVRSTATIEVQDNLVIAIAAELKQGLECQVPYSPDRLEMAERAIAIQKQHMEKALELLQDAIFRS